MAGDIRTGTGIDVHRLVRGRKLILCGVDIGYDLGLAGHSDADVAVHALMDAMLGALALGDIGKHFPDSDPAYEGADSMVLLQRVKELTEGRGYILSNADITIICQAPKLAPYIDEMRENIAGCLGVEPDQISVKATTTEGLGYAGRGEGIAAQAAVLMERKPGIRRL